MFILETYVLHRFLIILQVLEFAPYKTCFMCSRDLGMHIMRQKCMLLMRNSKYIQHLTFHDCAYNFQSFLIDRESLRDYDDDKSAFPTVVGKNRVTTDMEWAAIREEDAAFDLSMLDLNRMSSPHPTPCAEGNMCMKFLQHSVYYKLSISPFTANFQQYLYITEILNGHHNNMPCINIILTHKDPRKANEDPKFGYWLCVVYIHLLQ